MEMVDTTSAGARAGLKAEPAVELRAVTVAYGREVALSRVTLALSAGVTTALLGPPGAGKSTLLRCLSGSIGVRAGEISVLGTTPLEARAQVGFVPPQDLVDWRFPLSLAEMVGMGRRRTDDRAAPWRSLRQVGLEALAQRRIGELEAHQRSRALLAR